MPFVWEEDARIKRRITKDVLQEIKRNIDELTNDIQADLYEWNTLQDINKLRHIKAIHLKELQNAINYIDDNNYCKSERIGYDGTVQSSRCASEESNIHSGYASTYDRYVMSGNCSSVRTGGGV